MTPLPSPDSTLPAALTLPCDACGVRPTASSDDTLCAACKSAPTVACTACAGDGVSGGWHDETGAYVGGGACGACRGTGRVAACSACGSDVAGAGGLCDECRCSAGGCDEEATRDLEPERGLLSPRVCARHYAAALRAEHGHGRTHEEARAS